MRLRVYAIYVLASLATTAVCSKEQAAPHRAVKSVNLENKRHVALQKFEVAMATADPAHIIVVGRLEKPLGAGEKASLALNGAKGCVFEAHWAFDDIKDSGDIDLCGNAHIVLAD